MDSMDSDIHILLDRLRIEPQVFRAEGKLLAHARGKEHMRGALEYITDRMGCLCNRYFAGIFPFEQNMPLGWFEQSQGMFHQGGLPCSIVPQDGNDVPLVDLKIDPLKHIRLVGGVAKLHIFEGDQVRALRNGL